VPYLELWDTRAYSRRMVKLVPGCFAGGII